MRAFGLCIGLALAPLLGGAALAADGSAAETQIEQALQRWTAAFNDGEADKVCDLFAPDLRYDYPGFPERGYTDICTLLHRSLADDSKHFQYELAIKEIMVSGDLAVVRLVWTLEISKPGSTAKPLRSVEPGIDVFRKQPDGAWKIARYLAYEER
jgi:uncharacterized protein (TIGR02246 family)